MFSMRPFNELQSGFPVHVWHARRLAKAAGRETDRRGGVRSRVVRVEAYSESDDDDDDVDADEDVIDVDADNDADDDADDDVDGDVDGDVVEAADDDVDKDDVNGISLLQKKHRINISNI